MDDGKITRSILIMIEIDTKTHTASSRMDIVEDGELKREWTPEEVMTTARVLALRIDELLMMASKQYLNNEKDNSKNH